MERQWKLGEDMHETDNMLDGITFDDVILALHSGERVIDERAVRRVVQDILESQMQVFEYILNKNIDEIIKRAKRGRE